MKLHTDNKIILVIFLILLLRIFLLWLGYDRLPYLPTVGDEVIINDAAVSLSRGEGFVAKSFENDPMGIDKVYGHYPPLFHILQSIIFRVFGISPFTLRFLNIFSQILSLFLLLYFFQRLKFFNVLDTFAFFTISCLLLLEPVSLCIARQARMDMLAVLFGIISVVILLPFGLSDKSPKWRWILSSIFIGLALSVHTESNIFWLFFLIIVIFRIKQLGWRFAIMLLCLPILFFMTIWILVHKGNSIYALMQMKKIASLVLGGFSREYFVDMFFSLDPRIFMNRGGVALLLVFLSWFAISIKLFNNLITRRLSPQSQSQPWLYITTLYSIGCLFILHFFSPQIGSMRISVALPLALLTLGIAISHLSSKARNFLIPVFSIFILFELLCLGVYFNKLHTEYKIRDPNRFDFIVNSLPPSKKVAADPRLWFSFIIREYPVCVLMDMDYIRPRGWGQDENRWFDNPGILNKFDIVILSCQDPLLKGKIIEKKYSKFFIIQNEKFVVFSDSYLSF